MAPSSKRRRLDSTAVEEISFDPKSRKEYLTGFHKRKLQRAKEAREVAEKKERAERIEERKKLRKERQAELERHVQEVNAYIQPQIISTGWDEEDGDQSEEAWNGISSDSEPEPVDHEAEYIDEEKYTTVTVEAMDVTREGIFNAEQQKLAAGNDETSSPHPEDPSSNNGKRKWTKEKPKDGKLPKLKLKRKKFRYENKADRKITTTKERMRHNSKKARARGVG